MQKRSPVKLKIAFMFYDGGHNIGTGPMINGLRMLTELKKRGHEVLAIILAFKGESAAKDRLADVGVKCRIQAFPDYRQKLMKWILKQVKAFQPDVFVPNFCISGLFVAKWVKKAGIPTIAAHRADVVNKCRDGGGVAVLLSATPIKVQEEGCKNQPGDNACAEKN